MERKKRGRQRIAMAKMEKESNRQVTFSKRRFGLFKKASELSILCGAQVAVIVFSPGNKAFSFGNPSVNAVIDQFLTGNPSPETGNRNIESQRNATMRELSQRLNLVENMLEVERQRGRELDQMRNASRGKFWWEEPIDKMNIKQLEKMKTAMEELKNMAIRQAEQVKQEQVTSDVNSFMVRPSFLGGGSSVPLFLAGGASDDPASLLAGRGFSGAPFDVGASSSAPPILVPGFSRGSGH